MSVLQIDTTVMLEPKDVQIQQEVINVYVMVAMNEEVHRGAVMVSKLTQLDQYTKCELQLRTQKKSLKSRLSSVT